jgi:hypothetical protein
MSRPEKPGLSDQRGFLFRRAKAPQPNVLVTIKPQVT